MTNATNIASLSIGRDYAAGYSKHYEFVVFLGDTIAVRKGGFRSAATARRNGIKAAAELAA
jgi:hypothetical protein